MTELRINDPEDGFKVAELAGTTFIPGHDVCFATHSGSKFLGGTLLTNYTGAAMWIHDGAVSEHWATRDLLWATFHYPFVQLGCKSLIGMTPSDNAHALAFSLKVGFEVETLIRDCLPGGGNLVVTRMWRDKCRWLHVKSRRWQSNHLPSAPLTTML